MCGLQQQRRWRGGVVGKYSDYLMNNGHVTFNSEVSVSLCHFNRLCLWSNFTSDSLHIRLKQAWFFLIGQDFHKSMVSVYFGAYCHLNTLCNAPPLSLCLLQTPITYCAANTSDLEHVVHHVKGLFPHAPVLGAGVSLGGWVGVMVSNCLHFSEKMSCYGQIDPSFVSFLCLPFSYHLFVKLLLSFSVFFFFFLLFHHPQHVVVKLLGP